MDFTYKPEESMKALISLGVQGHFPLFLDIWMNDPSIKERRFSKITGLERAKAKKLFSRVSKHRSLEHKKIVVQSMNEEERSLFMKAFFKIVEGKILDQRPELH